MALSKAKYFYEKALERSKGTPRELSQNEHFSVVNHINKNETFNELVKNLNIHTLHDRLIDFAQDKNLIQHLNRLIDYIEREMRHNFRLMGHLVKLGSCRDGSKVDRVNEMDTLYVVDEEFQCQIVPKETYYNVILGGKPCLPSDLVPEFADVLHDIVQRCPFLNKTSDLKHGGFDTPRFSGVRYNGPAVTLMLTYDPPACSLSSERIDLSLDITLAFKLLPTHPANKSVNAAIEKIQRSYPRKIIDDVGIHLVRDVIHDAWFVTTSLLEAEIFNALSDKSAVKRAFQYDKIMTSDLNKSIDHQQSKSERPVNVTQTLDSLKDPENTLDQDNMKNILMDMRYAHYFLTKNEGDKYCESGKSDIAVITTALKHIILAECLKYPNFFKESENVEDDAHELVLRTFEVLHTLPSSFKVPHAMLDGLYIDAFSLSKMLSSENEAWLRYGLKEQCRGLYKALYEQLPDEEKNTNLRSKIDALTGTPSRQNTSDVMQNMFEPGENSTGAAKRAHPSEVLQDIISAASPVANALSEFLDNPIHTRSIEVSSDDIKRIFKAATNLNDWMSWTGEKRHKLKIGEREEGDEMLYKKNVHKCFKYLECVDAIFEYRCLHNEKITLVEAYDQWDDDTGGIPECVGGGVGLPFITIKVTSMISRGFNHTVTVYGKNRDS